MNDILTQSTTLLRQKLPDFKRFLFHEIYWSSRLIGIKGARGTGKTTLLLQWLKSLNKNNNQVAYFSLDDVYFTKYSLKETLLEFHAKGGEIVVLDEVHKYPNWSQEIKNIYDFYADLQIVFTGSSIIDLKKQEGDLSRRALMYELPGLSYREFLSLKGINGLRTYSIDEIITNQQKIYDSLPSKFKPLEHFAEYNQIGYYPFLLDEPLTSHRRMNQLIRTVVEYDMAEIKDFDVRNAKKMLQLLYIIAQQVPFKPNISELAQKTGIHRTTLYNYLEFLQEAKLISLVYSSGRSTTVLQKADKIYLNNPTLAFALAEEKANIGNIRETFFYSQVSQLTTIELPKIGDFLVDNKYVFEVGGKNKTRKQINDLDNAYLVKDDIAFSSGNVIPLWLFGFLY